METFKSIFQLFEQNKQSGISQLSTKDIENLSPIQSCDVNGNLVSEISKNANKHMICLLHLMNSPY